MAFSICSDNIPDSMPIATPKLQGHEVIDELTKLGFKLDFVCFRQILYGAYESFELNPEKTELKVKIFAVTFYNNGTSTLKDIK